MKKKRERDRERACATYTRENESQFVDALLYSKVFTIKEDDYAKASA